MKIFPFVFSPLSWLYRSLQAPERRAVVPAKTTSPRNTHRVLKYFHFSAVYSSCFHGTKDTKSSVCSSRRVNIFEIKLSAYFLSAHLGGKTCSCIFSDCICIAKILECRWRGCTKRESVKTKLWSGLFI